MPILLAQESPLAGATRDRCYDCFRPVGDCFCDVIPTIDNKTEVLILQHMRERFHPFNTARIVHLALENSSLLVDHTKTWGPGWLSNRGPGCCIRGQMPHCWTICRLAGVPSN